MQEFLEDFADARPQGGTNLATHIVPERVVLLGRASDSQRRLVHGSALTSQAVASAKRADVEWLRRTDVVAQDAMLQQVSVGELWSAHILDASLTKIVRDATARMCPLAYVAQARCSMNAHFLSFTCAMRKVLKSMAT
jgi:hypothetical protein